MIAPTLPPVIMNAAITSVYIVIAVWIPVTSVPTSAATTGIETFITELSRAITNWPAASAARTAVAFDRLAAAGTCGTYRAARRRLMTPAVVEPISAPALRRSRRRPRDRQERPSERSGEQR